ncbi:unnamed protein product [Ixodes pacificus]
MSSSQQPSQPRRVRFRCSSTAVLMCHENAGAIWSLKSGSLLLRCSPAGHFDRDGLHKLHLAPPPDVYIGTFHSEISVNKRGTLYITSFACLATQAAEVIPLPW